MERSQRVVQLGTAPLAGREIELDALRGLLERAEEGQAQLGFVSGEPGIGKSRLLGELRAHATARGWQVLRGDAFEGQQLSPYQPFVEVLRDLTDRAGQPTLRRLIEPW